MRFNTDNYEETIRILIVSLSSHAGSAGLGNQSPERSERRRRGTGWATNPVCGVFVTKSRDKSLLRGLNHPKLHRLHCHRSELDSSLHRRRISCQPTHRRRVLRQHRRHARRHVRFQPELTAKRGSGPSGQYNGRSNQRQLRSSHGAPLSRS